MSLELEPKYYELLFECPLLTALLEGNYSYYSKLKKLGVKDKKLQSILNQKNKKTQQGLLHLLTDKDKDIAEFLLNNDVDVNLTNTRNQTPLHIACGNGNIEVVKLLLKKKANSAFTDLDGCTPLELACKFSHVEVVRTLLKHGNEKLEEEKKKSLIQMTHPRYQTDIAKLFGLEEQSQVIPTSSRKQLSYRNFFTMIFEIS